MGILSRKKKTKPVVDTAEKAMTQIPARAAEETGEDRIMKRKERDEVRAAHRRRLHADAEKRAAQAVAYLEMLRSTYPLPVEAR